MSKENVILQGSGLGCVFSLNVPDISVQPISGPLTVGGRFNDLNFPSLQSYEDYQSKRD